MSEMSDKMMQKLRDLLLEGEFAVERLKNVLRVKRVDGKTQSRVVEVTKAHPNVNLPEYLTPGSAGMDIYAEMSCNVVLPANSVPVVIGTGIKVAIQEGYQISIRPRSGLSKKGIIIPNAPGLIDSDYRGEIKIMLVNTSNVPHIIEPGDRVAQMLLEPVTKIEWLETDDLPDSDRGEGGFGSTGK